MEERARLCWCVALLAVFYGAGVPAFMHLERGAELDGYRENAALFERMKDMYSFQHCEDPAFKDLSFCKDQATFSQALRDYFNRHGNAVEDQGQWTALGTTFFLTHLATTIGYGNSHPDTYGGRLAVIAFALCGIPIMGFALAQVVRLILTTSSFLLEKLFGTKMDTMQRQVGILWCLLMLFLFGGALVYKHLESWTYLESLYFCFVTLSTVGFGDYLPSSPASKAFSILYMVTGLGVCASIIAVFTGLVATGHETVDAYLTSNLPGSCQECCGGSRTTPDES